MEHISGYLVVAKASDFKPLLLYGVPESTQNEPTSQFLLNDLHPFESLQETEEAKRFLSLNEKITQMGVLYFEMEIADSLEEVCALREAPSSVFVVDLSRGDWNQFKIFGPRAESELILGFDSRCEINCNGFVPFGPVEAEPGNDCYWAMSEFARQGCISRVRVATWEHRWIEPLTPITQ